MLDVAADWDALVRDFTWAIPPEFNMAECVESRRDSNAVAIIFDDGERDPQRWTFADLSRGSARLANALAGVGVSPGDRVAILLPQRPEAVVAHLAAWRMGAISLPLTTLFGPQALAQRLADSQPSVLVCELAQVERLVVEALAGLEEPPLLVVVGSFGALPARCISYDDAVARASARHEVRRTASGEPALLSFTSGTTGSAKGALHAHRTLLGHLPGVQLSQNLFPRDGDTLWTPADWAWLGGLMNVLVPSLWFGVPVIAAPRRFEPEEAWRIVERHAVTNSFLPPTALRLMEQVRAPGASTALRAIASGGEALGEGTLVRAREAFGCVVNEFYGMTEVNQVVANCAALFDARPGSMGRAVPGHRVAILDEELRPDEANENGEICVGAESPSAFLGYWQNPAATAEKVVDGWIRSGDSGRMDADGYLWFAGRNDDIITSAGYRIGPSEIEDCLRRHPAVRFAAAVGMPDPVRTEVVKAFVELNAGHHPTAELEQDLRDFVRSNLAAYLYPRLIEFVDEIPLTNTGKVRRAELRARGREPAKPEDVVA